MTTLTIFHGKKEPLKAVGKNQVRLLSFLERFPGWRTCANDRATARAIEGLLKRKAIAYNPLTNQACIIYAQKPIMKLTPVDLQNLKELRAINAHGQAYEQACRILGWEELEQRFAWINREHERLGELTRDLSYQRQVCYQDMLKKARKEFTPSAYKLFYGCF